MAENREEMVRREIEKEYKILVVRMERIEEEQRNIRAMYNDLQMVIKGDMENMESRIISDIKNKNEDLDKREKEIRDRLKDLKLTSQRLNDESIRTSESIENITTGVDYLKRREIKRSDEFRSFINKILIVLITAGVGIITALIGFQ